MVITDNQDDVVPTELSHEVKPDVGLVRVWWYGPQKGQVDALQEITVSEDKRSAGMKIQ